MQKFVNNLSLPGLRKLLFVLLQDAVDAAPLRAGDPLQNVFFRLIALFEVNPIGMVVLVCQAFALSYLLYNLLRALRMSEENGSASTPIHKRRSFSFGHFNAFDESKRYGLFDAADLTERFGINVRGSRPGEPGAWDIDDIERKSPHGSIGCAQSRGRGQSAVAAPC